MAQGGQIHIGTSGWHYRHWQGRFYPPGVAMSGYLTYYAKRLASVEINSSFYRLPAETTLLRWRDETPTGFIFALKASRFITHQKKLKEPERHLPLLLERARVLGPKLGPVLFQLPPGWRFNGPRLEDFLQALPGDCRYALEMRDPTWLNEEAYEALRRHGVAFCIYDLAGRQSPRLLSAGFVYLRLHGPGGAYQGCYSREFLAGLAGDIRAWAEEGREVFCYFDNDEAAYAAQNALELVELVG